MDLLLQPPANGIPETELIITGSKSESNRLLLLKALYPLIHIENSSVSDDTRLMQQALSSSTQKHVDIHHAGTAMRFLTAFYATQQGREVVLTGSQRMKERPISILVNALRQLGASIHYQGKEGFPPLRIKGQQLQQNKVTLKADISSQYISALLLIAPKLPNGLKLTLEGKITSLPYIKMTLALLHTIGVATSFQDNTITVQPKSRIPEPQIITVESDWSSASYFYSIVALSQPGTRITLSSYKKNSLQGDAVIAEIYQQFGVLTTYAKNTITLTKTKENKPLHQLRLDLSNAPDIAQTIAVSCFGLGIPCKLSGLHTLKIKETDRLQALKTELEKLGAAVIITDRELVLKSSKNIRRNIPVTTYHDHRMAMAFAPLAIKIPIIINDAKVVSKSYPDFWNALGKLQFSINKT